MKPTRKQIISETVLNELTGLGAFITPDFMAREALVKGWSNPRTEMPGYWTDTGYTPQEVMGGFAEHGSPFLSPYDRVSAYMVANARNRANLRKKMQSAQSPDEQEKISNVMSRRYRGLARILKRAKAVYPQTTVTAFEMPQVTDRMYRLHYPNET